MRDQSPDPSSFVGLFKPQLFRSLLHKAKTTTHLGVARPTPTPFGEGIASSVPLFEEPTFEAEEIPSPKLFKDVVQRQWSSPVSGPNLSTSERRLYNLAPDLSAILQVPSVDPPVVALSAPSILTGPPEENLCPEDKHSKHSLIKAHQAAAWSVKASMAASFFNRASILWLRQLQEHLPISDTKAQQDVNKIMAALEYSVDATLNASRFAAKAIGSTMASHHLLWLRQWQADAKTKWQLASSPFAGDKLFGAPLKPLSLVKSRDKHLVLPSTSCRAEPWPSASFRPFRGSEGGYSGPRAQRYFPSRQGCPQDR